MSDLNASTDLLSRPERPQKFKTNKMTVEGFVESSYRRCEFLHCLPFKWEKEVLCPVVVEKPTFRVAIWCSSAFCALIISLFSFVRMLQINMDDSSSLEMKLFMQLITPIHFSTLLVVHLPILKCKYAMAAIAGRSRAFFSQLECTKEHSEVAIIWVFRLFLYGATCNVTLLVVHAILNPSSPDLITSILPQGRFFRVLQALTISIYIWYVIGMRAGAILIATIVVTVASRSVALLKSLSGSHVHYARSVQIIKTYRQLSLIASLLDEITTVAIPAIQMVVVIPAIFAVYSFVRLDGVTALFCGIYASNTLCVLEILLNYLGEMDQKSVKWLEKANATGGMTGRRTWLWKKLHSLRPVRVSGGVYFIDKQVQLTVLKIVLGNAINVLMLSTK